MKQSNRKESGHMTVRTTPEMASQIALLAHLGGVSMNAYVVKVLSERIAAEQEATTEVSDFLAAFEAARRKVSE